MHRSQMLAIGSKVAKWRHRRGFSQAVLAKITGVSPVTIAHLEASPNDNVTIHTLSALAVGLGVKVSDLIKEPKKRRRRPRKKAGLK
jgi:transcriptional regulator with XRE-family HTH domain